MTTSTEQAETNLEEIADRFGTPCYVYDATVLRDAVRRLRSRLHPQLEIFYSLKANPNAAVYAVLRSVGARAEVSSAAELRTALEVGTPPAEVIFLGPGKSVDDLALCLQHGVLVVAESFGELELLDALAAERGRVAAVAVRLNPLLEGKGSGLTMGGKPRQFGIDEEELLAGSAADWTLADRYPHLDVLGVQAYMGTRILDATMITTNTGYIVDLAERVATRHRLDLRLVDIGGGLGVPYFDGEGELDLDALAAGVNPVLAGLLERRPGCRLIMESGRYLAADAGTYLTRVRYVKTSRGERFAVCDGGTNHHMAAVGIGSFVKRNFPVQLVGALDRSGTTGPWNLAGPLCTPNDLLAKRIELPELRVGDVLAVRRSGAYGPSASPGLFLSHGFPAEVLVLDGVPHLVRQADDPADVRRGQRLPAVLAPTHRPAG